MSRIGLGLMRISNMSVDEVEDLIIKCINNGINFFDLADIYGKTKCETIVGEVLKRNPDLRDQMYLQTKIGINTWEKGYDNSYEYIINKTRECLARLHTDHLDSLLLHRPDIFMDADEVNKAIRYLKDNGMIRDFGVSNFTQSEIEYLQSKLQTKIWYDQVNLGIGNTDMLDQTMYANIPGYVVSKESDSLFFYLKKEEIKIQCWSPFQYGFFEGSVFNQEKYPKINAVLEKYAIKYNTTKCAIATAFLLMLDKNLIVITGSTDFNHIKESLDALDLHISKADWYRIYEETGHLLP